MLIRLAFGRGNGGRLDSGGDKQNQELKWARSISLQHGMAKSSYKELPKFFYLYIDIGLAPLLVLIFSYLFISVV